jgi:hypothetical protein
MNLLLVQCLEPGASFAAAGSVIVLLAAGGLLLLGALAVGLIVSSARRARSKAPHA